MLRQEYSTVFKKAFKRIQTAQCEHEKVAQVVFSHHLF